MNAKEVKSKMSSLIEEVGNVDILNLSIMDNNIEVTYLNKDGDLDISRSDLKIID